MDTDNFKVLFLWAKERSGSCWLQRLIQQNFARTIVIVRWKHLNPYPSPELQKLCLDGSPVLPVVARQIAADLEKTNTGKPGRPGMPLKAHLSDDIAHNFHMASDDVDDRILARVAKALEMNDIFQVGIVKHPQNWWPSILQPWQGSQAHMQSWLNMTRWQLQLRDAGRMILFRWEDLLKSLSPLSHLEEAGFPRLTESSWQNETRVVGSHALKPPPSRKVFSLRPPGNLPPQEKAKVPDDIMQQLGYEWDDPLLTRRQKCLK